MKILGLAFAGIESDRSDALAAFLRDVLELEGDADHGVHSFRLPAWQHFRAADGRAFELLDRRV